MGGGRTWRGESEWEGQEQHNESKTSRDKIGADHPQELFIRKMNG